MDALDWSRYVIIGLSLGGAILWLVWSLGPGKDRWGFGLTPISYLAHLTMYMIARLSHHDANFLPWNKAVLIHSAIVMLLGALVMLLYPNKKRLVERKVNKMLHDK